MKAVTDRVVNVALLLTCAVVTTAVLQRVVVGRSVEAGQSNPDVPAAGTRPVDLNTVKFNAARSTLVVYSRSTCHYCSASMPFYASLRAKLAQGGARFVVASQEPTDVTLGYLKLHHVDVDQAVVTPLTRVPTPTMILVDNKGVIQRVWVGQQDEAGERAIVAAATSQPIT